MIYVYNTLFGIGECTYVCNIYIYIYIYIYIHTHIHENRSIPVLSIPFQRVFVSTYVCMYVRTLVNIVNRRQHPKVSQIYAINFKIQLDSNRVGSYFKRVDFQNVHAR